MSELEIKENFYPDFIILDYLNIFNSIRFHNIGDTYTMVKAVTEEFRGLAVEKNIGVWSATQLNRTGYSSSDPELTDSAESWGVPMTADLQVAIYENDDFKVQGKYQFKFLKSRCYGQINPMTQKFIMHVNKDKQQIYEAGNPRPSSIVNEDLSNVVKKENPTGDKYKKGNNTGLRW